MYFNKSDFFGVLIIFTIAITISSQFTSSFAQEENNYLIYEIPFQGLLMEYPDNWRVLNEDLPEPLLVLFVLADDSDQTMLANMAVMSIPLDKEMSSMEAADDFVLGLKNSHPELTTQQEGNTKIADYASRQKIISYTQDSQKIKQDIVVTVVNNNAYVFFLTSSSDDYTKYQPIFNKFLGSIEIRPEMIPQIIDNIYKDAEVSAQFPEDWLTMKSIMYDQDRDFPVDSILSFHPSLVSEGGVENIVGIVLMRLDNEFSSYFEAIEGSECVPVTNNVAIIELNKMKAIELEMNCVIEGYDEKFGGIGYELITKDKTFVLVYMASEEKYDSNFSKFEEIKKTVMVENTLDLSDYSVIAAAYDMTVKEDQQKITDEFSLPLILYDGSTISNFDFDAKNMQISFQPVLNSDDYFQVDIEPEGLLEQPYSIDVDDGENTDFFIIDDKTTDKTIISVFAESSTGMVTINGSLSENPVESSTNNDSALVPEWIKSNAEFWSKDMIDDTTFVSGIQFLIKNGILDIPTSTTTDNQVQSDEIPPWVKSNAEFWSQGLITDKEFLNGIEYMVKQGIIKV